MAILEVCANSIQSARNAVAGGADRIELCQNLNDGGITPSYGLIQFVKTRLAIPVHVLIRARPGNFIFDDDEFQIMLADVEMCRDLGCEGVVVGMLNGDHQVDIARIKTLVAAARPMSVAFNRAFDDCIDKTLALEEVIETGCERVLTSGGESDALAGMDRIARLVHQAKGRIVVMPGAGITQTNMRHIMKVTGAVEFHGSAGVRVSKNPNGKHFSIFSSESYETQTDLVRRLVRILRPDSNHNSSSSSRGDRAEVDHDDEDTHDLDQDRPPPPSYEDAAATQAGDVYVEEKSKGKELSR